MRWTPGGTSGDVEDDRDQSGGGGGFGFGGIHVGIGGFLLLLVLSLVFKHNFLSLIGLGTPSASTAISQPDTARDQSEEPEVKFVSFVLDDAQKTPSEGALAQGIGKFFTDTEGRKAEYVAESKKPLAYFLQDRSKRTKLAIDAVLDQLVAQLAN